jgi:retron-type reverse transcriptase
MGKKSKNFHGERDSAFFRLRSRNRLADLLFVDRAKLQALARADDDDLYFDFLKPKSTGGNRIISAPRGDLKAVQRRIADLLQRIAPPEYLFAPVKGRSYVDNAAEHLGARSIRLLDVQEFFPSCTANKVIWFFHRRMQCSADVAAIVRGIVTRAGRLPQGSPCSPILAYLCYVDMWEEIARIVESAGCRLSIYADDLTISGRVVPGAAIWEIKKVLRKHGHRYNAQKERSKHLKPAEITGVILRQNELLVPNRQRKALHGLRHQLAQQSPDGDIAQLTAQLRGREAQMNQVASGNLER